MLPRRISFRWFTALALLLATTTIAQADVFYTIRIPTTPSLPITRQLTCRVILGLFEAGTAPETYDAWRSVLEDGFTEKTRPIIFRQFLCGALLHDVPLRFMHCGGTSLNESVQLNGKDTETHVTTPSDNVDPTNVIFAVLSIVGIDRTWFPERHVEDQHILTTGMTTGPITNPYSTTEKVYRSGKIEMEHRHDGKIKVETIYPSGKVVVNRDWTPVATQSNEVDAANVIRAVLGIVGIGVWDVDSDEHIDQMLFHSHRGVIISNYVRGGIFGAEQPSHLTYDRIHGGIGP